MTRHGVAVSRDGSITTLASERMIPLSGSPHCAAASCSHPSWTGSTTYPSWGGGLDVSLDVLTRMQQITRKKNTPQEVQALQLNESIWIHFAKEIWGPRTTILLIHTSQRSRYKLPDIFPFSRQSKHFTLVSPTSALTSISRNFSICLVYVAPP